MQETFNLQQLFDSDPIAKQLQEALDQKESSRIKLSGLSGSRDSFAIISHYSQYHKSIVFLAIDKEEALYYQNDLENILGKKQVHLFPDSFKRPLFFEETNAFQIQQRIEATQTITESKATILITYPEALFEKITSLQKITESRLEFQRSASIDLDTLIEKLVQYGFERVDFVYEPGQFSLRGGIIDIFSFAGEYPYRIELLDDTIESIRSFDPINQLSIQEIGRFSLVPQQAPDLTQADKVILLNELPVGSIIYTKDWDGFLDKLQICFEAAQKYSEKMIHFSEERQVEMLAKRDFIYPKDVIAACNQHHIICLNHTPTDIVFDKEIISTSKAQPSFNKNFNLLIEDIKSYESQKYTVCICSDNKRQIERFYSIFEDLKAEVQFYPIYFGLREGFIDETLKLVCYTDHQIFSRFHGYRYKQGFSKDQAFTIKLLRELQSGDYVTHIDHGIGRFAGLEKMTINGQQQEAVRLIYKNDDILYVSIHSLHKISKYVGQDGTEPTLSRIGSDAWKQLKARTKQKVKDIAKELIALYAKRKASKGFAFSPDNYMQAELEASFIYEDTPDQYKATNDVKADMEKPHPMDRLVCGDVGFGKTEVAIRAAFKAVQDGKQVAILVPTTILALQHYKTFKERYKEFPVDVDYVSRFRSTKEKNEILKNVKSGKTDILIGTHALLNKKTEFKDLGLLIIDEEQKFGVAAKEKLRHFKANVDTLILTATPIPRTLQFSLMAARDLSVINTPPPNRQPIYTERRVFNDELIRDAILNEVYRGGQVFFVHNRVKNLAEIGTMIQKLCPTVEVGVAHGQLVADKLEKILSDFVEGKFEVLVCTNIIETGLDIPNANTMIINNAHQFGLSDLHQLRGRIGRSNRKAYCYLFAPPSSMLTQESRKRLKTIEEFSDLGSGFHISMKDLDIRGAGNLLGGEQSGFITEMGFETYQKILEEAVQELKETDFKDLFEENKTENKQYIKEVTLDTDIEMWIPDNYVSNIQERLSLYQQLDRIENEPGVTAFVKDLADRFGPVPPTVIELINGLRIRWIARILGFERITLKKKKLQLYFISNPSSRFFETDVFKNIISFISKEGPKLGITVKQSNTFLLLIKENIHTLKQVEDLLLHIKEKTIPSQLKIEHEQF